MDQHDLLNHPVIDIIRDMPTPRATLGRLHVNGAHCCFTLEPPWRGNARDVSCIPAGTYKGKVLPSPKFKRDLPELLDVPGRSQILIHAGNTTRDTLGCILVGLARDADAARVNDSRLALTDLFKALAGHREFWINIKTVGG